MSDSIIVWPDNDPGRELVLDRHDVLDAFAHSSYARPKSTPMGVQERVHLFIESRYGTFVAPDSADADGRPSMSSEDYAELMAEAEQRLL